MQHLGVIPQEHRAYDEDLASERIEDRKRLDTKMNRLSIHRAVEESDYTLGAIIGESALQLEALPVTSVSANELNVGRGRKKNKQSLGVVNNSVRKRQANIPVTPKRKQSLEVVNSPTKKRRTSAPVTPKRKIRAAHALPSPPITPEGRGFVVL